MFLNKFSAAVCAAFLVLMLSACGGGDSVVTSTPAPVKVTTVVTPVEADVTFRQANTRADVLPGEQVRATVAVITCKEMNKDGVCPSFVPVGDIGIIDSSGAEYELANLELYYLGQRVDGWVRYEGGGNYRFRSNSTFYVFQAGSLEVRATVSPWATSGVVHTLAIKTISAAYDKTVEVVSAKAELVVRADSYYEPVELSTNSTGYINPNADGSPVTVNFTVRAGTHTSNSFASLDFGWVKDLVPDTPVMVCRFQGGLGDTPECFNYGNADRWGEFYLNFGLEPQVGGGLTTYQVSFTPAQPTYMFAQRVEAWVNGAQLAPRIQNHKDCTALSNQYCKG